MKMLQAIASPTKGAMSSTACSEGSEQWLQGTGTGRNLSK